MASGTRRQDRVHREGLTAAERVVERFNGTMRDEKLNGEEFNTLTEARVVLADWVDEYNGHRPHRGLGFLDDFLTPLQFADRARKELAVGRSKGRA
ncbi:MAG: integrase core domain-containing protein [Actinomycetota bacterium]